MTRIMKTAPYRATVICDSKGRILVAMATISQARPDEVDDQRPIPSAAGLMSSPGTKLYEIDIPAALVSPNGSMHALMEGYRLQVARGARAKPQLVARRVKKIK